MRVYSEDTEKKLQEVSCNCCGKSLLIQNGIIKEGYASYRDVFGYFSNKDGQVHSFDLCEACYDKLIAQFKIPVSVEDAREII